MFKDNNNLDAWNSTIQTPFNEDNLNVLNIDTQRNLSLELNSRPMSKINRKNTEIERKIESNL